MNQTTEIRHNSPESENTVTINWCLGNTCNYSCSYCPENLHSGSMRWMPFEQALFFCDKLVNHYQKLGKNIEFLFTGGEPTLYPYFSKLLGKLKESGCRNIVISNGSRTIRWWQSNGYLFDKVVLTYHHEFADNDHFIQVVELLGGETDLHINFTMVPNNFRKTLAFADELRQKHYRFSGTLKPLLINFGSELYDYSDEQIQALKAYRFEPVQHKNSKHDLMKKVMGDKTEIPVRATDLILKGENNWNGWKCWAGLELIYIDYKGDVYRATCKQGGRITNTYLREDFEFPAAPITCEKNSCHCITDIRTSKFQQ